MTWLTLAILVVSAIVFYVSVIVSRQRQQIARLIEETAILSAEVRDLRAAQLRMSAPETTERVVARPTHDGAQPGGGRSAPGAHGVRQIQHHD